MNNPSPVPSSAYFMWQLFKYDPLPQIGSGLCWVLFHSWPLFPGLLAKAFFDTLEGRATFLNLNLTGIVLIIGLLALVRIGFVYIDIWVGSRAGFRLNGLVRRNLLMHILERPGAQALPETVGEAISTLRDDVAVMWGGGWAFDVLGFLIFALGGIAILLSVDARITLLVFIPIVTVILIAHVMRTRLRRFQEQSREATAKVTGSLGEIFGAVQAIQVAGAQAPVIDHLRRLGDERQRMMLRDRLLGRALDAVFSNTASLGAGLTLLVAAGKMRNGDFSIGDFALFATYLMQVTGMTGFLGYIVAEYQQMGVSFKRGVELLQGAPPQTLVEPHPVDLQKPAPTQLPLIKQEAERLQRLEVVGLTHRYLDSAEGIEEISFSLDQGSLTVVTGRIGAGKTTLLRSLLGLLEPDAGEVYWNGCKIEQPAQFLLPPRVAYTPQVPMLLSGTLRENILLGLPDDAQALNHAVQHAVLDRDLAGFPNGLETMIGTRGMKLSGGQSQRTAAARMFMREPDLLVFDDLSSALDVETEQVLWQRVFALGATCLVVSHRRAVLERADQILLLEQGRLIGSGKLTELLDSHIEMQRLVSGDV